MELRQRHRILGAMVGTCSTHSIGLDKNTLPVELMPWETKLLLEQNIAQLLSKQEALSEPPTSEQIKAHDEHMTALQAEQMEIMKCKRAQDTERHMADILTGKRVRKRAHTNETELLQKISNNFVFDEKYTLIETELLHAREHFGYIFKMPQDRSLMYCVYRDCWLRGYYIISGETFGCDLLLYPGDPLLYHASHIVILWHENHISALELIAKSRISVSVNKIFLLAYFANDIASKESGNNDWPLVQYQTVERDSSLTEDGDLFEENLLLDS